MSGFPMTQLGWLATAAILALLALVLVLPDFGLISDDEDRSRRRKR